MDDDRDDDLFGDEPADLFDAGLAQDGPDLFGTEPDELILPPEPVPTPDPDMDLPEDEMDEIPVDPDESDESDEDVPDAVAPRPQLAPPPSRPRPAAPARRDAPLALYRRYRPDTFAEVIGQEHVTEPLQRALVNNRVNHAYLFSGPRGCGKTTSARILARCLNCEEGPTDTPCGVCRSCEDLARGGPGSIDVIEMDAATHGLVDDARALRERAFFSPVHSRYKIYIIDEAHMVTPQGFNALLKVVEEPPPHVKFIFATTEPEKVLGTIRSRTHHYPFRLVPPKTLTAYLARLCAEEGVRVEAAVLPLVVRAGAGSVRDSLSVLDQLLGGAGPDGVGYAQAAGLLGYTPDTLLDEIMDAFAAGDAQGVFACVDKVIEVGQDPRRFAEDLLRRLRDLIIVAAVPEALDTGLVDVAADQGERLITQARGLGAGELTRAAEVIANGLTEMRGTTAPRLHLELMCARVLLPGADVDGRGVHARLDRLERRLQMASRGGDVPAPDDARPEHPAPSDARTVVGEPSRTAPTAPSEVSVTELPAWLDEPHEDPWATPRAPARQAPRPPAQPAPEPGERQQYAAATPTPSRVTPPPPAPRTPTPAADPARFGTSDLRHVWPQVLEAVKVRRRVTWIALQQNTQVHALEDGVLTLAVNNRGAFDTLQRGGSDDIIREAVLEVAGVAPRIAVIATDPNQPGHPAPGRPQAAPPEAASPLPPASAPGSPGRPASGPASDPVPARPAPSAAQPVPPAGPTTAAHSTSPPSQPDPPHPAGSASPPATPSRAQQIKQNIQPTRMGAADEPEEEPDRDDLDVEESGSGADELLTRVLGAELIGEEPPS